MPPNVRIREVWANNLVEEMRKIAQLITEYDHVAMDTEFPGVVARPIALPASLDFQYQTLRCNVDLLKIIQLGIALSNADGQSPDECACWQFNFSFNLAQDMYAQDSIDLLTTSGIDFAEHDRNGIDVLAFGELLVSSGLVLDENVKWISFHGGYDFAYLLKVLTAAPLPSSERDFFELLELFFPKFYDLKYLMRASDNLHGGLNRLGEIYGCQRFGTMHQAGSDALLTLHVFFRMMDDTFGGHIDDSKVGILYGLGVAANNHISNDIPRHRPSLPTANIESASVPITSSAVAPASSAIPVTTSGAVTGNGNNASHHPNDNGAPVPAVTAS